MSDTLLAIDPGWATGWSFWTYDDRHALQRLEYGLIPGGDDAFFTWTEEHLGLMHPTVVVCERFNPALGTGGGVKDYEAMWVQGGLKAICRALGIPVEWQGPDMKTMCRDETLKRSGLWLTKEDVDWEDARDVNDSQIHALARMKARDHTPTVEMYWPPL